LHHIHFWNPEPEPKYIYYFSQSEAFKEWYNTRKDDQGAIYKDFEEKSTFAKYIFKEKDYYKQSILVYDNNYDDNDIETRIKNFKNINNEVSDNVEYLIRKLQGKNSIEKIEEIEDM